jgi:hypothetical protein
MRPTVLVVTTLLLLATGCLGLGGGQEPIQNQTGMNETAQVPAETATPGANATNQTAEVCKPQWTRCTSGELVKTRGCIDGHKVTFTCKPYWKAHNLTTDDIPSQLRFLADYMCYWENRDEFGFTIYYNPENMCAGPIVLGWKESCECGQYIDIMERQKPK